MDSKIYGNTGRKLVETIFIQCKTANPFNAPEHVKYTKEQLISNLASLADQISSYRIKSDLNYDSGNNEYRAVTIEFPFLDYIDLINSEKETFLIEIPVIVENKELNFEIYNRVAHHYFIKYLYDLFTIQNLALPGSFDLTRWEFVKFKEDYIPNLHSFYIELGCDFILKNFNAQNVVPIEKVSKLVLKLYQDHDLLPIKSIQKAINSLLHLSIESYEIFSPQNGLLVTYALESLIGGGIPQSLIVKRIQKILNIVDHKNLNNDIRDIYNWRNKIVHGEYSLPHPAIYDVSASFDKVFSEYSEVVRKGIGFIVFMIQLLAINDSTSFNFIESVEYTSE